MSFILGEWGDGSVACHDLAYFERLTELPRHCTVLALGSITFMDEVRHRMPYHKGGFLFCVNISFDRWTEHDLCRHYRAWAQEHTGAGLLSATIRHSNCGGILSAIHYICYCNLDNVQFGAIQCVPRMLGHILNAAKKGNDKGWFKAIKAPDTLLGPLERAPIRVDGLLRQECLYDVFRPKSKIARPCVFKPSGWAKGRLSLKEYFRAFNLPLVLDKPLAKNPSACKALMLTMSLVVVSAIFEIIWSSKSGGLEVAAEAVEHSIARALPNEMKDKGGGEEWTDHRGSENHQQKVNDRTNQAPNSKCKDIPSVVDLPLGNAGLRPSATPAASHTEEVAEEVESVHKSRLDIIKREHNLAKALKSDDAEVPINIWDEAICGAEPPQELQRTLEVLCAFMLWVYRRRLLKDDLGFLGMKYGGMKRTPLKVGALPTLGGEQRHEEDQGGIYRLCNIGTQCKRLYGGQQTTIGLSIPQGLVYTTSVSQRGTNSRHTMGWEYSSRMLDPL
jgi:hypothetical protein